MEAFAHVKYVRMSPRKVKLVCDMIRGKDVKTAAAYLSQTSKAACEGKEETESLRKSRAVDGLRPGQRAAMVEAADPEGHVDVLRIQYLK